MGNWKGREIEICDFLNSGCLGLLIGLQCNPEEIFEAPQDFFKMDPGAFRVLCSPQMFSSTKKKSKLPLLEVGPGPEAHLEVGLMSFLCCSAYDPIGRPSFHTCPVLLGKTNSSHRKKDPMFVHKALWKILYADGQRQ